VDENLEQSNVELTQEFTDLIIVQRGFQASSQVLQVANEMIEELLNLDRSTSS
jgi:flagellar hook protein FlgE